MPSDNNEHLRKLEFPFASLIAMLGPSFFCGEDKKKIFSICLFSFSTIALLVL